MQQSSPVEEIHRLMQISLLGAYVGIRLHVG